MTHHALRATTAGLLSLGILSTSAAAQSGSLRLENRDIPAAALPRAEVETKLLELGTGSHFLVRFDRAVDAGLRRRLAESGIELGSYLGSSAYVARATARTEPGIAAQLPELGFVGSFDPAVKLHADIASRHMPEWARLGTDATGHERSVVVVSFHADASDAAVDACLRSAGTREVGRVESLRARVVEIRTEDIEQLAAFDAVLAIEPPLPRARAGNDRAAVTTQVDTLRSLPWGPGGVYDLSGNGVNVMVHDTGNAFTTHPAFGGRVFNMDAAGFDPATPSHSTHVAGTILGDGAGSPGGSLLLAGMAPRANGLVYGWLTNGSFSQGDLYSNAGDMEADFFSAIWDERCVISNTSMWCSPVEPGFWTNCAWFGDYSVVSALIDSIVTGSLGKHFRMVWITGNDREIAQFVCSGLSQGYRTIGPPGTAKNCITVGAVFADTEGMTVFSDWGPTDDGRLKPDLVAPGDRWQSLGWSNGIRSCNGTSGYVAERGTSQAAPVVTGAAALFIEDYRAHHANANPRNATIKCTFVQTAKDLGVAAGFIGPDYQYGWGLLQARDAIDQMRASNGARLRESEVTFAAPAGANGGKTFLIDVPVGNVQPLKLTLAWDDEPAAALAATTLVNDLDLQVFDPNGTRYYPWRLNPALPQNAANQNPGAGNEDRLNNVEQVLVDAPASGRWRIEVVAFALPNGNDQDFSIAASHDFVLDCDGDGTSDAQELSVGSAFDCDLDGVPDGCEHDDCNGNGLLDGCDIFAGTSQDLNLDDIPDECASPQGSIYCSGLDSSGQPPGDLNPALFTPPFCAPPNYLRGFGNSSNPSGAQIIASGETSSDNVLLTCYGTGPSTSVMFFVGTNFSNPTGAGYGVIYGDGVRCAAGSITRLKTTTASMGFSYFPQPGDPTLSSATGPGVVPGSGIVRYYETYYRDSNPGYCTPATYNMSNGFQLVW